MEFRDNENLPEHIAIIMDGNGRWAKKRGASRIFGHRNAIQAVRDSTEFCAESGIKYLTLYAFSTENWSRPKLEVEGLMTLLVGTINSELSTLLKNNVQLLSIGDVSKLPAEAYKKLEAAKKETSENDGLKLVLALNYSGRWDIANAMSQMLKEPEIIDKGKVESEDISRFLQTKDIPDPELMIRTSGEMRISNFLLWQLAYTELYFTDVLWPDFRKKHLEEALNSYLKRERRFGMISEQVTT